METTKRTEGTVIDGSGVSPLENTEPHIEKILEDQRPLNCLHRNDCVYMRQNRQFNKAGLTYDNGYIHTVSPCGNVEKRDMGWIGILQQRHHKNDDIRKNRCPNLSDSEIASNYWSGTQTDTPSWEWVTKSARVMKVDADCSPVR